MTRGPETGGTGHCITDPAPVNGGERFMLSGPYTGFINRTDYYPLFVPGSNKEGEE